ncbi:tail fiber assembly protein [Enterobacter hormaechei]|uniref:tail fiber assembly protein n=1 Tax=Enterobacter cloacae complex TaxID=354276 RepID=UPI000B8D579E|nr:MULTISPECIES: tail fiber assembly protein [Enterobacter cloacae complex]ASQ19672.1 Prophage tail fiber assembly protein TfaE [Enterobacter cloacae]AXO39007.1 tail fiber assembly protein [Enterobacter hormaechei]MBN4793287.1 tail fiber assembly protein [Enterobacter cloacae]
MNKYKYSALNNEFLPYALRDTYIESGQWPDDGVDFDEDGFISWKAENAPEGKIRAAGNDGFPEWVDEPEPTPEELVRTADAEKKSRIEQANDYINSKQWPGKAAMGRLKDTEKEQYNAWLDYLDALEEVDTTSAPDIEWPTPPEV